MSNRNQPLGIDISSYQYSQDGKQKPDFEKIRRTTAFVAVRAGISWGYTDRWFRFSWEQLLGHRRLAYHVPYFGEDPLRQMDHFFRIVEPGTNFDHDRLVLDLELAHSNSKRQITDATLTMLEIIKRRIGRFPIGYSRANWLNTYLFFEELPDIDWWLANYLKPKPSPQFTEEHPGPPILPRGGDSFLIHQTAEKQPGKDFGVVSHYVDTNRWNGSLEDLDEYFGKKHEVFIPIIVIPAPEKPLYRAKIITIPPNRLRVRATPNGAIVDMLASGTEVEVFQEQNGWARIGAGRWVSMEWIEAINEGAPRDVLPVPLFSQRDPRWSWLPMGRSGIKLGEEGCLVTATASGLSLILGRELTPLEYGQLLNDRGGYLPPTNRMYWQMPRLLFGAPLEVYKAFPDGTGWESTVRSLLDRGLPAMARVDMLPGAGYLQHWVQIIGETNGVFWIHDPWYGHVAALKARYPHVFHVSAYGRVR